MEKKFYRDRENETELGELVTTEDLFNDYVMFVKDGSIDPTETSFANFLTNADERWGGTLKEVDLTVLTPRYFSCNYEGFDLSYTAIVCMYVPTCFEDHEVEELLCQTFDKPINVTVARNEIISRVCNQLHGQWEMANHNVGSFEIKRGEKID